MTIEELIYRDIEGTEDFVDVVDVDFGGGYEWDEFHAWYSPSKRRYFWAEGSGCSCNYFGEDLYKLDDFSSGSKSDLESGLRSYLDEAYSARPADVLDAVAKVKTFRASKAVKS